MDRELTCQNDAGDDRGEFSGQGQAEHAPDRPRQPQLGKLPHKLQLTMPMSFVCSPATLVAAVLERASPGCAA